MDIQEAATEIVKLLVEKGFKAYFVGEWVRDHILGEHRADIDIATSATPQEVMRLFPRTVPVGVSFGVVVVIHQGYNFEVSSFRREGLYIDGRHPEVVEMGSEEEDVNRRDFTINGMFWDPLTDRIIDYVGGRDDLAKGIVRAIGNANERFVEDRLRMIRAVRIACSFQFAMDADTEKAIKDNAKTLFPAVAMERVWQEFGKMVERPHFDEAIVTLHRLGLLPVIFPSLEEVPLKEIEQRVASFSAFPEKAPLIFYLLELFPAAVLEQQLLLCRYLKATNADMRRVECLWEGRELIEEGDSAEPVQWARYYAKDDAKLCLGTIAARLEASFREAFLMTHHYRQEELAAHIYRMKEQRPVVTSSSLRMLGIDPSPLMGALLREAERIAVNNGIEDEGVVLRRLKSTNIWPR